MQTTFIYGLIMAISGAVLNYAMYFLGYHDSLEKFQSGQMIGMIGGILVGLICLVLGVRARREETPAAEPFGYGRSFVAGLLVSLWGTLFGIISHTVYTTLVNPDFREIMIQAELAKVEARGASVEQAEGMIRTMMSPVPQAIFGFIFLMIMWTLISLVVAAFIRRAAPPKLAAA